MNCPICNTGMQKAFSDNSEGYYCYRCNSYKTNEELMINE